jgi:hypothetical protein
MSLTVVGSIAYDTVRTPFGARERMLGGAATHFALAASFFDEVRVVGPVGDDFTDQDLAILATRGTSTDDVERVAGGKTFFWEGEYGWDLNSRETIDTQLNVFETFQPKLSEAARARPCHAARSGGRRAGSSPGRRGRDGRGSVLDGLCDAGRVAERVRLAGRLPGEVRVVAAEVAVRGGLLVDRPVQVEVLTERTGTEVEVLVDQLGDLAAADLLGAEGLDHHRDGVRDADRVGDLQLAAVCQARCDHVLGHVSGRVGA